MDLWHPIHRGECPGLHHLGRYVIEESALDEVLEVLTRPNTTLSGTNQTNRILHSHIISI